jgi:hypothetical protein
LLTLPIVQQERVTATPPPWCGRILGDTVEAIVQALSGRYLSTAMLEGI